MFLCILPRLSYSLHLYLVLIIMLGSLQNMSKITSNFTLAEMIFTRQPLPNSPSNLVIINLCWGCHQILQPLRNHIGVPITITSGYRSAEVNKAVGGVPSSQHLDGCAADCVVPSAVFNKAIDYITRNLPFDQLLIGKSFFHVSWRPFGILPPQDLGSPSSRI